MNSKMLTFLMNILNYIFEGLIGCAILMCLASFFVFSDKEDIIEFNIAALVIFVIALLLYFIARQIRNRIDKLK